MSNEVLGRCDCPTCGGRAAIFQTKRKAAHLYTRCEACGLDQRTGKQVQQNIWEGAEWLGSPPVPPACIILEAGIEKEKEDFKPEEAGIEKEKEDFKPEEDATENEPKAEPKARGGWLAVLGGLGVVGIVAAVVSA